MRTLPVVVVHFAAPDWCARAVAAMRASTGVDAAVVVVDNSGDLGEVEGAEVIRAGRNLGYAGGANLGIAHALERWPHASALATCAHDFQPVTDAFERLVDALDTDSRLGIVGPELTGPVPSAGGRWNGWAASNLRPGTAAVPEWVSGSCLVIRRRCLDQVDGFDESLGSYAEDVELCLRARDLGWSVAVVPQARGAGIGSVSDARTRLAARNAVRIVARRRGRPAAVVATAHYAGRALRSTVAGGLVWRDRDRVAESRRFARGNWLAVADVVRERWRVPVSNSARST